MADSIKSIFKEEGSLSTLPNYEFRPQQLAMAESIADALADGRHLIVEAPTGIGKSLGYLVPAILHALAEGKKAVVSTHTKNLQSQLLSNDLPIVRGLIPQPFTAVMFKGRGNYLCTTRLRNATHAQKRLFNDQESDELARIREWSLQTEDGDREDLPFSPSMNVWQLVCSEKGACSPSVCDSGCFFQRARVRARSADLVIMNHALFFTLFGLQGSDEYYLFKDDFVIFDEAHTIEQVAGAGVGKSLSRSQVLFAIHQLYNPGTRKGLLARTRSKPIRELCVEAEDAVGGFFQEIEHVLGRLAGRSRSLRVRSKYLVADSVSLPLKHLRKAVEERQESGTGKTDFSTAIRLLWEAERLVHEFLELADPTATYWADLGAGRQSNVRLHAAPTSIADSVGKRLFRPGSSVIMTSGTLSVNRSLNYFQERIGAGDAETMMLDSPFDYQKQMRVTIARDLPLPDDDRYEGFLPGMIMRSIRESDGRALVLFTNARLMKSIANELREEIESDAITLLVQDGSSNRSELLHRFRDDVRSVLFGLDSFWMGVDVPGEALEHVVITRLPFSVPDHPLIESRMDQIKKEGGNPFFQYTLPEAVLKFKQGVGRLIRSTSDKGLVTVLDSRIVVKGYGPTFLRSLPQCRTEMMLSDSSTVELTDDGADW